MVRTIILGIIQGLTEFLPVSSSGHLVIFQSLLGLKQDNLTLNVFLHFGTLIPVFIIFWEDIIEIISFKREKRQLIWLIIIGTIPAGIIGYLFDGYLENLFTSTIIAGYMLLITGVLLYLAERIGNTKKLMDEFKIHNAFFVGLAQSFAILPGISRSGSTIFAALVQDLNREDAARFSFLLSIPVILGATFLKIKEVSELGLVGITYLELIFGTVAAALAGYIAIKYLLHIMRQGSLNVFAYYCWIIGLIIIIRAGLF
ncbi:MAG: undecaprenyl-diphosphate phosphatase [Halanaerobiales bacterium]